MSLTPRLREAVSFLALDCFGPVRAALVAQPDLVQGRCWDMLRAPRPEDAGVIGALAAFPLLFAPSSLGAVVRDWYAVTLPVEISRLMNVVFPMDSEGRAQNARFQAAFGMQPELEVAHLRYTAQETQLFDAFAAVEHIFVSDQVSDRDITIIEGHMVFDLNRDATYAFQTMIVLYLRGRIICEFLSLAYKDRSQLDRFVADSGLPITHNHLEGLLARVS
ncbi:MAG: hypothetical protein ACRC6I_11065 [Paracoccaceae bacterium]